MEEKKAKNKKNNLGGSYKFKIAKSITSQEQKEIKLQTEEIKSRHFF